MNYEAENLSVLSISQILQVFRQEEILKRLCTELIQQDSLTEHFWSLWAQSDIRLEQEEIKVIRRILAKGSEVFDGLQWWRGWFSIH